MKKKVLTFGINTVSLKKAELKGKRLKEQIDLSTTPEAKAQYDEKAKKIEVKFQNKIDPGN